METKLKKGIPDLSHWEGGRKPLGKPLTTKDYTTRYRKRNPEQVMINVAKWRAKKRGIPFNISKEDITIPEFCPVLGLKLEFSRCGEHGGKMNSPSIDRIIPELGYTKGNVRVISHKANSMKFTASEEDLIKFAHWVLQEANEKKI